MTCDVRKNDWMNEMNDWMTEMNDWMNEWMNEWMNLRQVFGSNVFGIKHLDARKFSGRDRSSLVCCDVVEIQHFRLIVSN